MLRTSVDRSTLQPYLSKLPVRTATCIKWIIVLIVPVDIKEHVQRQADVVIPAVPSIFDPHVCEIRPIVRGDAEKRLLQHQK